jgi:hypothetical protein
LPSRDYADHLAQAMQIAQERHHLHHTARGTPASGAGERTDQELDHTAAQPRTSVDGARATRAGRTAPHDSAVPRPRAAWTPALNLRRPGPKRLTTRTSMGPNSPASTSIPARGAVADLDPTACLLERHVARRRRPRAPAAAPERETQPSCLLRRHVRRQRDRARSPASSSTPAAAPRSIRGRSAEHALEELAGDGHELTRRFYLENKRGRSTRRKKGKTRAFRAVVATARDHRRRFGAPAAVSVTRESLRWNRCRWPRRSAGI